MAIKLNHLSREEAEAVILLAEYGTLTKGAELCSIGLSTFRRRILSAQKKMGIKLFEKENRRFHLQPGGELIVETLKHLRRLVDAASAETESLQARPVPDTIRYCYTPLTRTSDMIHNLEFLNRKYPDMMFEMVAYEGTFNERMRMLNDFGKEFTIWPGFKGDKKLESYFFQQVFSEELVLVVGSAHPFSSFDSITPDQLKGREIYAAGRNVNYYLAEAAGILSSLTEDLIIHYSTSMDIHLLNSGMKYNLPVLVPESWSNMYPQMHKVRIRIGRHELAHGTFRIEKDQFPGKNLVPLMIPYGYYHCGEILQESR